MFRRKYSSSVFQRIVAGACCALSLLASVPASALTLDYGGEVKPDSKNYHRDRTPLLQITSPKNGAVATRNSVKITLDVGKNTKTTSLTLRLNGKDISSKLSVQSCDNSSCKETASVDAQDGMTDGNNVLRATVEGKKDGDVETVKSQFHYHQGGALGAVQGVNVEYYTPASVGITTTPNGGAGGTWVTITTGTPAGVNDPVQNYPKLAGSEDPYNPGVYYTELPYPDVQLPINCPGQNYQAIILDRRNPSVQETSTCANSEPAMESLAAANLGRALDDRDLIIFGTTPSNFASHDLDTSSIGGTDYTELWSQNPSLYPEYYIIIGVKGGAPGSAHENYLVSGTFDTPYTYFPTLGGTLMQDSNGNYNYLQSGERDFEVMGGSKPSIQIGWQSYTPPANQGGLFWLMVFDRMALQPINAYKAYISSDCAYTAASQSCGMLFDVKDDGGVQLATTLSSISPRNLIVLTAIGCPFDNASQASAKFGGALQQIGGMIHSPVYMNSTSSGCNYSLVSVNDGNHLYYNSKAALSWSYFSAQQQAGYLHGYLAPDNGGLYDVAGKDQMAFDSKENQYLPTVDYSFEHLASQNRADWVFEDTTDDLAAYHDISNQLLTDPEINELGPNNYDVRYFYTAVQSTTAYDLTDLIDSRLSSNATNPVKQSSWDPATAQEFNNVRNQILVELQVLKSTMGYLTGTDGSGGVRGLIKGGDANIFGNATKVASDIGQDVAAAQSVNVTTAVTDWINLVAAVVSTIGPITGPETAPFAGALSGALRSGTAAEAPLTGTTGNAIPGAGSKYDLTLAQLSNKASDYTANLVSGFDGSVDNILSDYWKLAAAGTLASNSASGWNLPTLAEGEAFGNTLANGARIQLWNDVLPQLYGIRVAAPAPSTNPNNWGSIFYYVSSNPVPDCLSAYRDGVPSSSMTVYTDPNNQSKWDVNILAEGPTWTLNPNDVPNKDYAVSSDLTTLLTTNQQVIMNSGEETGLNIPPMMLIANGPFTYSPVAMYSSETCKP